MYNERNFFPVRGWGGGLYIRGRLFPKRRTFKVHIAKGRGNERT